MPERRVVTTESWCVWTERESEAPRRGFGEDALQATLNHLRKRGERTVRVQRTDAEAIVIVRLAHGDCEA